jgi:DNA-binding transcriptional ArsR family regulator
MTNNPHFPGQAIRQEFTLEQVKVLASVARSEVFWTFSPSEPRSAGEIAREIGKSAPSVHYHVQELTECGLLIAVGTRKRRSRVEALYVHAAANFLSQGTKAPKEYRENSHRAFAAMTRGLAVENAALHKAVDVDAGIGDYYILHRRGLRMTHDEAIELRRRLAEVLREFKSSEDPDADIRVNLFACLSPTSATSKAWIKGHKKPR